MALMLSPVRELILLSPNSIHRGSGRDRNIFPYRGTGRS